MLQVMATFKRLGWVRWGYSVRTMGTADRRFGDGAIGRKVTLHWHRSCITWLSAPSAPAILAYLPAVHARSEELAGKGVSMNVSLLQAARACLYGGRASCRLCSSVS